MVWFGLVWFETGLFGVSFWFTNFHKRKLKRINQTKNCNAGLIRHFPLKSALN